MLLLQPYVTSCGPQTMAGMLMLERGVSPAAITAAM
jgi:hypothetical protein